MNAFLLANWKTILGMIATAALAYLLHALDVDRLEKKEAADLASVTEQMTQKCNQDKAITSGVSNDLNTKRKSLTTQLTNLKRLRNNSNSSMPVTKPTAGSNGSSSTEHGGSDDYDTLIDYAGDAEEIRLQLLSCQTFITETWKENGQ